MCHFTIVLMEFCYVLFYFFVSGLNLTRHFSYVHPDLEKWPSSSFSDYNMITQ